ncbi:hypothetical protein HDU88_003768 [Geranomyces variabilis]|nr:hypothetical protein HDU88_003768 [Geranomyces variabilis]
MTGSPEARLSPAADLLYGSLAGMVGMLFQFPFDTLKVRLQTQPHGSAAIFDGPLDCAAKGFRQGGFLSFYKGLSAPLIGAMIENSALFVAFNHIQGIIRRNADLRDPTAPLSLPQLTLAGFFSGALVSFILTPVELVKCQLQVQDVMHRPSMSVTSGGAGGVLPPHSALTTGVAGMHTAAYGGGGGGGGAVAAGPWGVIVSTLRTHGLGGFYHGHVGTFLREAGGGAAWFGTYELVLGHLLARQERQQQQRRQASSSSSLSSSSLTSTSETPPLTRADLPTPQIMLAGALAGMTYNAALFPADCVKSRQQTMEAGRGFVEVAQGVWARQGWRGFYKGFGITVARSAPTSAMIFATYELLSRHAAF